jgi:hypothetical protein
MFGRWGIFFFENSMIDEHQKYYRVRPEEGIINSETL